MASNLSTISRGLLPHTAWAALGGRLLKTLRTRNGTAATCIARRRRQQRLANFFPLRIVVVPIASTAVVRLAPERLEGGQSSGNRVLLRTTEEERGQMLPLLS